MNEPTKAQLRELVTFYRELVAVDRALHRLKEARNEAELQLRGLGVPLDDTDLQDLYTTWAQRTRVGFSRAPARESTLQPTPQHPQRDRRH